MIDGKDTGKWLEVIDGSIAGFLDGFADRISNSLELGKLDGS